MKHIRTIIETRLRMPDASIRTIAHISRCSRPVVDQYLAIFKNHPLDEAQVTAMSDAQLAEHLGIGAKALQETEQNRQLALWLAENQNRLHEPHMTRRLLHEEYCEKRDNALQYSQFCVVLKQRSQEVDASGMFDHKAGDKMYIDFTGSKFHWQDEAGTAYKEEVYLAVLGASSCFYAIPVPNQRKETFCAATKAAFEHFGGVPRAVVPDCLKSAVLSHDGHEPVHTPLFGRLVSHYRTVSIPARPHHPKDKPVAETTVKVVYTRMLAKLNGRIFADRTAMLAAWMDTLKAVNTAPFQKLPGSRLSRFEEIDKPALKPLPETPFVITEVLTQTVRNTLAIHVSADETAYSVPSTLQGKIVEIIVTPTEIEIWHQNKRYASHPRSPGAGKVINAEHLPIAQAWFNKRNPEEQVRTLRSFGHHVGRWAEEILAKAEHEDIAWNVLRGLQTFAPKALTLIDIACRLALARENMTLKEVKAIVSSGEAEAVRDREEMTVELPFHENIRGGDYFAGGAT